MRKKAWKKNIAILLVIAMMLTIMPMTVFAEGEDDGADATEILLYNLEDMSAEEFSVEVGTAFNVKVKATTDSAVKVQWTINEEVDKENLTFVGEDDEDGFGSSTKEGIVFDKAGQVTITATFLDENDNIITNEQGKDVYSVSATFNVTEKDEEIVAPPLPEPPEVEWEIPKSKTATNLDENFESKVTLSLPSAQEPVEFDVMFVLDKSKSPDKEAVSEAVEGLLDKIEGSQGKVNIGVVTFNKTVVKSLELTPLTAENLDKIQEAIGYTTDSGTNIHAGLQKGMKLLDQGTAAKDKKYLILVSDGITYLYNDENGDGPKTINNHGQSSPDDYKNKYGNTNAPADWPTYLGTILNLVKADGTTYEGSYVSRNEIVGASKGLYGGGGYGNDPLEEHAMSVDKALLRACEAYRAAIVKYGTTHVYAIGRANSDYPWAGSFMNYLSSISAKEQDIEEIINHDIYYLLDAGSQVKDYMGYVDGEDGYNFDFVNEAVAMTLKVGETEYAAEKIADNQYGFKPIESGYAYTITYNKGNGKGEEHFVWDINVPVSNFAPVQLTYTVKLMNPKTEAGTYGVYDADGSQGKTALYTNNSATLHPVDSNKTPLPIEEFAKPTVSYTVKEPETPIIPGGGGGGTTTTDTVMTVQKVWAGDNSATRPDSVKIILTSNGTDKPTTVTLNEANNWTYQWRTSVSGWNVKEENVPAGYKASYSRADNTFTITNTYAPDEVIPDPDVPSVVIDEPGVPTTDVPGTPVNPAEIGEPQVPLGDAPKTGDANNAIPFVVLMMMAGLGLVVTRRKFN